MEEKQYILTETRLGEGDVHIDTRVFSIDNSKETAKQTAMTIQDTWEDYQGDTYDFEEEIFTLIHTIHEYNKESCLWDTAIELKITRDKDWNIVDKTIYIYGEC